MFCTLTAFWPVLPTGGAGFKPSAFSATPEGKKIGGVEFCNHCVQKQDYSTHCSFWHTPQYCRMNSDGLSVTMQTMIVFSAVFTAVTFYFSGCETSIPAHFAVSYELSQWTISFYMFFVRDTVANVTVS